jgi:glycosyltransferase involved in cell wall biosynthesis
MKPTYISWAPYCSRSDHTARELGGVSHMVYRASLGSNVLTVWLKYLVQAADTWRLLSRDRPDAVFVMSPPVFAVLTVWLWCRVHRAPYVVDAHTAAFLHPRWRYFQWLQNALCRRAATTIVTNEHLAGLLHAAGARTTIVRDVPIEYRVTDAYHPEGSFSVAVVCSFNYDEPIGEMLSAAARLPDVRFYMTGNSSRLQRLDVPPVPGNVVLTGFLSDEEYGSLIANAGAVMTLTTRDHTMLRGAYEAVYQGTPVIVSDWPVLREAFDRGAIHVDNSAASIVAAVARMRANLAQYRGDVMDLRARKLSRWTETRAALLHALGPTTNVGDHATEAGSASRP